MGFNQFYAGSADLRTDDTKLVRIARKLSKLEPKVLLRNFPSTEQIQEKAGMGLFFRYGGMHLFPPPRGGIVQRVEIHVKMCNIIHLFFQCFLIRLHLSIKKVRPPKQTHRKTQTPVVVTQT